VQPVPAVFEVFTAALRLGLTSFGGPTAHLGYFRREYVERRGWLDDAAYAELVAIAQFLPGPSSSQVGAAVGAVRAGAAGALAAWLGFTLPSALLMALFAELATTRDVADALWLHALKLVAVAVVLDAVLGMARTLTRTALTAGLAVVVGVTVLLLPTSGAVQVTALILAGGVSALALRHGTQPAAASSLPLPVSRRNGLALLGAVVMLAVMLPFAPSAGRLGELGAGLFRSGALVFGGGHVVLPLLRAETVPGLVAADTFLAGYGAAQAVPGPLFTFGAFLGEVAAGPGGAVVATVAIFAPGLLLFFGVLPFWQGIRSRPMVRATLIGVNAGVVGLLAAAWVDPIVATSVTSVLDAGYAAVLFALLRWRLPPIAIVAVALVASPMLAL